MNRSSRIALTTVATSVVIAGAAGTVALGPLSALGPVAAQGHDAPPIASEGPSPDASACLDEALARVTREATGLQAELVAARHRLDAGIAAAGPATIPGGQAVLPSTAASLPRRIAPSAPRVHTRTGASSATGHHESEAEDD